MISRNFNRILKKKYPFQEQNRPHFIISLCLAIWIFVFLWFTEPFELSNLDFYKKLEVIPLYGLFGGFSYCLALYIQRYLHGKYDTWVFTFEFLFLITALTIASVFMYAIYYSGIDHSHFAYSYLKYVRLIYIPSLIIILPFIVVSRILTALLSSKKEIDKEEDPKIVIKGSGKYEMLQLKRQKIIYVKSDNIYVDIFYEENNDIESQTVRIKLSEIESILPELFKTHRSYLINPIFFKRIKKENDKVALELKYDITVPVSRAKKETVLKSIPFTTKS